jgi:hypothetical protein
MHIHILFRFQFKCPAKECGAEIVMDSVFRRKVLWPCFLVMLLPDVIIFFGLGKWRH